MQSSKTLTPTFLLQQPDFAAAPHLMSYTREVVLTIPPLMNLLLPGSRMNEAGYGSKLAVTTGGGSKYPRHIDNVGNNTADTRKLTVIVYLNPEWEAAQGGHLRIFDDNGTDHTDISPDG
jgi:Rps23 Pro-64 3,4-dihydroxylase Tpa1-like proline 4-hydroxylase